MFKTIRQPLSTAQVAALLGLSDEGVRQLYKREKLPGRKDGRDLKFDPEDVMAERERRIKQGIAVPEIVDVQG